MINKTGVYTTKCPACTRSILMHVLSDGSISPTKCAHCEMAFAGLENGEERNTFTIVPAVKKLNIFSNEASEERKHTTPVKTTKVEKDGNTKSKRESFKVTW